MVSIPFRIPMTKDAKIAINSIYVLLIVIRVALSDMYKTELNC